MKHLTLQSWFGRPTECCDCAVKSPRDGILRIQLELTDRPSTGVATINDRERNLVGRSRDYSNSSLELSQNVKSSFVRQRRDIEGV